MALPNVSLTHFLTVVAASGVSSMSKAKSQTFDPFADLGSLGSNLPGEFLSFTVLYVDFTSSTPTCGKTST